MRWLDNLRHSLDLLRQPARCIHVGDRESDIFVLYCLTRDLGAHFVVRMQTDRLAGDGDHKIFEEMEEVAIKGHHRVDAWNEKGDPIWSLWKFEPKRSRSYLRLASRTAIRPWT